MHTTPLTPSLIPAASETFASAFRRDECFVWLRPRMELNPDGLRHHAAIKLRQRYNTPGIHIRVAISDDNDSFWDESKGPQVLGYAVYERSGKLKSDDLLDEGLWGRDGVFKKLERKAVAYEQWYANYLQLDKSYDYDNLKELTNAFGAFDPIMEELMDLKEGKGHLWLTILCVDAKFQRKGVGKKLLEWGAKQADKDGIATGLVASPVGSGLYKKLGYRDVKTITYGSIEDWGMIRWPGGGDKPGEEHE